MCWWWWQVGYGPLYEYMWFPCDNDGQVFKKALKETKKEKPHDPLGSVSGFHPETSNPVVQKPKVNISKLFLSYTPFPLSCVIFHPLFLLLYSPDPLLHSFSHLCSHPPTPISQATICSSRKRLQWWKRKGFKQSHRPGLESSRGWGKCHWGKAWGRGAHHWEEALLPTGD